jgi:hypothetical protein
MAVQYGYLNSYDLKDRRVSDLNIETINRDIDLFFQYHNQQMDRMIRLLATRTTEYSERFSTPANARLQPLDENGRAKPVKGVSQYSVSYPLQIGGHAWGSNYVARQRMTVEELQQELATAQIADINWVRDHIFAALFYVNSTNPWTWPDELKGDLSVYGLANGDSVTYFKSNNGLATDDHVLDEATFTQTLIEDVAMELKEHPQNGNGPVIVWVPTASVATVKGFTDFIPISDGLVQYGSVTTTLRPNIPTDIPGEIFGAIEGTGAYVAEWTAVPDNYLIAMRLGGIPPLRMREDPAASLRGFNLVAERQDHPWYDRQFMRMAGFGAYNRVGAVVAITNNATYAVPTGYSSPMA